MSSPRTPPLLVAACVKWVDLHPGIDPLHGAVTPSPRGGGFSEADTAAVEVALRLGDAWGCEVVVVSAGPESCEQALAALAACGAARTIRVEHSTEQDSVLTAEVLAPVLGGLDLGASVVVCGDLSYDRGSGSVPALLAHRLGAAQALGLLEVEPSGEPGRVRAVRRLDGARREELEVLSPAVLSVEGATATLRRAGLRGTLGAAGAAGVERRRGRLEHHVEPPRYRPWRPRARVLAPPTGDTALARVVQLTDALVDRQPPRTVVLEPAEAAKLVVEQLREWGYLDER